MHAWDDLFFHTCRIMCKVILSITWKDITMSLPLPVPPLYRDLWWLISKEIDDPDDWHEFRSACPLFLHSAEQQRDFGPKYMRYVKSIIGSASDVCALTVFDGKLVSAGEDYEGPSSELRTNTIKMWTADGKLVQTLDGHYNRIDKLVVFSRILVSHSEDGTLIFWNRDGTKRYEYDFYASYAGDNGDMCAAFNDEFLACVSNNGSIDLWDANGKKIRTFHDHNTTTLASCNDMLVSSTIGNIIKIWNVEDKWWKRLVGHENRACAFTFHNGLLISGDDDSVIKIWNVIEELCIRTITATTYLNCLNHLCIYQGYIVAVDNYGTITTWDMDGNGCSYTEQRTNLCCVAVFDGKLVTGSHDNRIRCYDSIYPSRYGHVTYMNTKLTHLQ